VDVARTEELRAAERKARLARGKPYDQFVAEWSKKSPPLEILEWYGTWPDAKPVRPIFRP
jgi:acetophenone carboxylase